MTPKGLIRAIPYVPELQRNQDAQQRFVFAQEGLIDKLLADPVAIGQKFNVMAYVPSFMPDFHDIDPNIQLGRVHLRNPYGRPLIQDVSMLMSNHFIVDPAIPGFRTFALNFQGFLFVTTNPRQVIEEAVEATVQMVNVHVKATFNIVTGVIDTTLGSQVLVNGQPSDDFEVLAIDPLIHFSPKKAVA